MREYFKKRIIGVPLWVYIAALLPRAALFFLAYQNLDFCIKPDSLDYINLASNLTKGFGFFHFDGAVLSPETFRTPGYPLFLSILLFFPVDIVRSAVLTQVVLNFVTVIIAWKCFENLAGSRGAIVGFLLFSLDYVFLMHVPMLLAETLFVFLLLLAAMITLNAIKSYSLLKISYAGFMWAIVSFVKPVTLYSPFLLSFLWLGRKKLMALFLVFAYSLPLIWFLRNYVRTGYFTYSSVDGISLLRYPAAEIIAMKTSKTWAEIDIKLRAIVDATYKEGYKNDAHKNAVYKEIAINIIKEEPVLLARYVAWGFMKTIAGTGVEMLADLLKLDRQVEISQVKPSGIGSGTLMLLAAHPWLWTAQVFYILFLAFMYFSCIMGFYRMVKAGLKTEAFFLAAAIAYLFVMASSQGYYRYRIPMLPFMAVCSSMIFLKKQ